jgi:hypothetical protein
MCSAILKKGPLTQEVEEDGTAILRIGVAREVNPLLAELVEQVRRRARQLDPDALDPIAQLRADSLHDGNGATLIQVNLCM